jgi:diguanylate cyclase (GGDEF)-like protein/PAS domain S-box-containing protein
MADPDVTTDFAKPEFDPATYKALLESTQAIPWKIDWASMQFAYIGPQIEPLLGWTPASWLTVQDWADRIHPDDRERVVSFCVAQSQAGVDHEADYRALKPDGGYVWIRDVVHVVRDADQGVEALVGFMFDISDRKRTEQQLLDLQAELRDLSFKDALTGLANRRRFDQVVEHEWSEARRTRQPLSLVMVDIDDFKQYNDCYGHLQGDACLKQVSDVLASAVTDGRGFIARFGGEEFALVLPETDEAAACRVAERCRALLAQACIAHARSRIGPMLTISAGVGTAIPDGERSLELLEQVDRRLYRAKQLGRDRIVAGA